MIDKTSAYVLAIHTAQALGVISQFCPGCGARVDWGLRFGVEPIHIADGQVIADCPGRAGATKPVANEPSRKVGDGHPCTRCGKPAYWRPYVGGDDDDPTRVHANGPGWADSLCSRKSGGVQIDSALVAASELKEALATRNNQDPAKVPIGTIAANAAPGLFWLLRNTAQDVLHAQCCTGEYCDVCSKGKDDAMEILKITEGF